MNLENPHHNEGESNCKINNQTTNHHTRSQLPRHHLTHPPSPKHTYTQTTQTNQQSHCLPNAARTIRTSHSNHPKTHHHTTQVRYKCIAGVSVRASVRGEIITVSPSTRTFRSCGISCAGLVSWGRWMCTGLCTSSMACMPSYL
ncbi:hypothetical protein BU24DRAFT_218690 [Aaosphaeria arxii CBS 175.79]|uniref:Uncharacterized protein n=1 Tax=Aaosphaeria arxii CBS 175.79 TaxID=1450172 RepID=A0A6A5XN34_9PLEO|nr:uncharacterized protein BU24DRAFT_218690 [Aaosphaeria arxii CBS 175.79]KAF2014648.1 hypothetical protein BU24DRAFT_218690 [Aaosphaeria arxii CBS 175.79]